MKEIWKDIENYEGLYQVSNFGNVKNLINNENVKQQVLGFYKVISLTKNNKKKLYKVHRLVAKAFIPNTLNLPIINHKDENKENNKVDNLEWCSYKYNTNYKDAQKRKAKAQQKKVCKYDKNNNLIKIYNSLKEAEQDTKATHICSCCKGRRKTSGGFVWKYKENV